MLAGRGFRKTRIGVATARIEGTVNVLDSLLSGDCAETETRLSDYLDGALSRWRRNRLVRHLTRCEGCQAVLSSLTVAVERLQGLGRHSPPPSPATVDAVVERVRHEAEESRT